MGSRQRRSDDRTDAAAGRLRRSLRLRSDSLRRSHAGSDRRRARPPRRAAPERPDRHRVRSAARPSDGLRVRNEPVGRAVRLFVLQRHLGRPRLRQRVGGTNGPDRRRVGGRVPRPVLPDAVRLGSSAGADLGLQLPPHHPALERDGRLDRPSPRRAGDRVAMGPSRVRRGARSAAADRVDSVRPRRRIERPEPRHRFQRRRRRGSAGRHRLRRDAVGDRQSRLRPGRAGSGRAQPHGVRDLLSREAQFLSRGQPHLRAAVRHVSAVPLAPDRQAADSLRAAARRRRARSSGGDDDSRER